MNCYKTPTRRGRNQIVANASIETSADGERRIYGRNVKMAIGYRQFDSVRVFTLKQRRITGNGWETVSTGVDRETAEHFLGRKKAS
jgi:hypothetical protein